MKKVLASLFLSCLVACPAALLAQQYGLEDSVRPEVEEAWNANVKTSFRLTSKIEKCTVMIPKVANPEPVPSESDKEYGFIPFTRSYMAMTYYNYRPLSSERKFDALKVFASQGEYEPLTIGLYPLANSDLSVSVSDLACAAGKIACENIEIASLRHMLKAVNSGGITEVRPEMLKKGGKTDLKKGVARIIWLTLRVPENTPAGTYEGSVTLSGGKKSCVIKISAEVLPFKLLVNPDYSAGWFGSPREEEALKQYVEHGNNAVASALEPEMSITGDTVSLDFSGPNKMLALLKKYDLLPYAHQMFTLQAVGNELVYKFKVAEFSPEFNKLYKQAISGIVDWCAKNKVRMALWVVDEPREKALNIWNRNYVDTIKYIKLTQEVPGAIALVDTHDVNFDVDYTPMTDVLDIIETSLWKGSAKLRAKCDAGTKAQLWIYNSGRSRSGFGFCPWKAKAKGRFEWAYDCGWNESTSKDFMSWSTYRGGDPATGVTYPTKDGRMSTPSFEMCREGIDDYKYLYTLSQRIAAAEKSAVPSAVLEAKKAAAMLALIVKQSPEFPLQTALPEVDKTDIILDEWRYKIGKEIVALEKLNK